MFACDTFRAFRAYGTHLDEDLDLFDRTQILCLHGEHVLGFDRTPCPLRAQHHSPSNMSVQMGEGSNIRLCERMNAT
jgi:hypothetical protein